MPEFKSTNISSELEIKNQTVIEKIRHGGITGQNFTAIAFCIGALLLSGFSLYTGFFGLLESWKHRMIHLSLILFLAFSGEIAFNGKNKKITGNTTAYLMLALLAALAIYAFVDYQNIIMRMGQPNVSDKVFGTFLIIIVIMASKKRLGWAVTLLGCLFIFYALYGNFFPGDLYHRGLSYTRFIDLLFNQTIGILGVPIKVAAEYVIMFIIFGAFLTKSGAGQFFIKLAFALTGRMWGGPAKTAVVASALMATINGSGVGNAVATGSITIPLMKRVGYKPHFAAAVEAAASNGGMITPPIMASVAFLIAEFTKTPYSKIMLYGLIPAFLYFGAVILMVHFEAKRLNLKPMEMENIPNIWQVLKQGWYYLLPIVVLAWLLIKGYSPMLAASTGIIMMVVLSYLRKETRMGLWEILSSMEEGAKNTVVVSVACAVAGIVVGVITGTGLGIKFSSMILSVAGNNMLMVLILTMFSSIVLGMGMTAAAVYIIVSALTVPALLDMGVMEMPAHFFVYYYGIASAITPPVALAAYGAAGIAGADQNRTAFTACRLAIVTFIVPFAFVFNPALMAIGTLPVIITSVLTALIGIFSLSAGFSSWLLKKLTKWQQVLLIMGGIGLITHFLWLNLIGLGILVLILAMQFIAHKRQIDAAL